MRTCIFRKRLTRSREFIGPIGRCERATRPSQRPAIGTRGTVHGAASGASRWHGTSATRADPIECRALLPRLSSEPTRPRRIGPTYMVSRDGPAPRSTARETLGGSPREGDARGGPSRPGKWATGRGRSEGA